MMDLEVVGRHALLFDDDAMAAFVNSTDALVEWNSLLIDRYDVRHLLSSPPPPRRRRNTQQAHSPPSAASIESELDHERYLDLPPQSEEQEPNEDTKLVDTGSYHAVAFPYGNADDSTGQNKTDAGMGSSGFHPPFPVPESLLQSLPPTDKVHLIMARTAIFVSTHGGQSEFILRVKQGDNPTFGFLMLGHHLHPYFRFLVDNKHLLQSDLDVKSEKEKGDFENKQTGGALSLLGSVYGSGEDEDAAGGETEGSKENVSRKDSHDGGRSVLHGSGKTEPPTNTDGDNETVLKRPSPPKSHAMKKTSLMSALKTGTTRSTKKGDTASLVSAAIDKFETSTLQNILKIEPVVLEPPSDLKRSINKIVEFILKNGKQYEAVLIEQDNKYGRFPFLLPSNQYHPYYLKVLQKAEQSKLTVKSVLSEKSGSSLQWQDKKTSLSKENDDLSLGSAGCDIPYDSNRKERFKMVIGKSKKDVQDMPSKAAQPQIGVAVDAAAAAAILQAATRGMKNPYLGILPNTSVNGDNHGHISEVAQMSSVGTHLSFNLENVMQKSDQKGDLRNTKAIAKTAANEVANEADSTEAHLTRDQKLKAERLKRAKMFVAMIKSGIAPFKTDTARSSSMEPEESGVSAPGGDGILNLAGKEREGSSVPSDGDASEKKEKLKKKSSDDEYNNRKSRRKYRSRSRRHEEDEDEEEKDHKHLRKKHYSHQSPHEEDGKKEQETKERDHKRARKKHRSHSAPHQEEDDEDEKDRKHSKKKYRSHSSSEEEDDVKKRGHKHSRKKHRSHHSSLVEDMKIDEDGDDEERHHKYSRKKHKSRHSSHHSRDRDKPKRHYYLKNNGHRYSHKHKSLSDDEYRNCSTSDRHGKRSQSEEELEEGEISSKASDPLRGNVEDGASREASLDLSVPHRPPSQPSEVAEVSDDLRAKIRAMLMANM